LSSEVSYKEENVKPKESSRGQIAGPVDSRLAIAPTSDVRRKCRYAFRWIQ